jgi:hypothetical protein
VVRKCTYVRALRSRDRSVRSRHDWACEESVVNSGLSVLELAGRGAADQDRAMLGNGQIARPRAGRRGVFRSVDDQGDGHTGRRLRV